MVRALTLLLRPVCRPSPMGTLVVVGAMGMAGLAAMIFCTRQSSAQPFQMSDAESAKIMTITSRPQLDAMFSEGGKAVVYLSATW